VAGASLLASWGLLAVSGGITLERQGQIGRVGGGRLTYWQISLDMVRERPWQGYGYGSFGAAFAQHRDERFADRVDKATTPMSSIWSSSACLRLCRSISARGSCSATACAELQKRPDPACRGRPIKAAKPPLELTNRPTGAGAPVGTSK
jgi:hypothetical protein